MRLFAALLVVLLLGSAIGVGASHPADGRVYAPGDPLQSAVPGSVDSMDSVDSMQTDSAENGTAHDGTTMRVSLRDDGNARWNVTTRFLLQDENETEAFRELAAEYESGETSVGFGPETFERITARTATDRDHAIESVERSAKLRDNGTLGTLVLSFTWTNFTQVEDDQIILGDVFATESGTWLPDLARDQRLVIDGPDGYYVYTSNTSVTSGNQIAYEGPRTFDSDDLWVTYAATNPDTSDPNGTTTETDWTDLSGLPGIVLLLFVVSAGGVGAYALTQRRGDPAVDEESRTAPTPTPAAPDSDEAPEAQDSEEDEEDVELLSDEERVLRLLRNNDGRMKQANIVSETNWSNAKVSQLLSKMDERDQIDKLRIGRENLITLPDEDVTDVD